MKYFKLFICIILIILIIALGYLAINKILNSKQKTEMSFSDLTKHKTNSINDTNNLNIILENLNFADNIVNVEKKVDDGKETLIIHCDCTNEEKILEYYRNYHKLSLTEKNSVILFSLIENLEEVSYIFNISNIDFAKEHHLPVRDNKFVVSTYDHTRDDINKRYNQDVRNFAKNPETFLQYNIDLNTDNMTLYYYDPFLGIYEYDKLEITNEEDITNILNYIKTQNFGSVDGHYDGMCTNWLDLNNGYIIGVFGGDYGNYGAIIKGDGEDIFINENRDYEIVYKTLPIELVEYVENIIKSN